MSRRRREGVTHLHPMNCSEVPAAALGPPRIPRQRTRLPILALSAGLALLALILPGLERGPAAELPDWQSLRASVVDLEVYQPGAASPIHTVGFALDGAPGILACFRLTQGAERVIVRTALGSSSETGRFLACDPEQDLILLDSPKPASGLRAGTPDLLSLGQVAFAFLPPASRDPVLPLMAFGQFQSAGGTMLALAPGAPSGAPLADSLGRVVGMIEALQDSALAVGCVIPVERLLAFASGAQAGGELRALAAQPAAFWTQPAQPQGAQVLGAVLARGRRLEQAVPCLRRALAAQPDMPAALLEWGMLKQAQNNFEEAKRSYRRVLELRPEMSEAYLYLGSCLNVEGLYPQSQGVYEEGLRRHPQSARLHVNLGGIYFAQDRRALAESSFREALRLDPDLGIAHYNLGVLLGAQGRPQEARAVADYLRAEKSGFAGQLAKTLSSGAARHE
jgi:tetratricopeptide (TPR) repeat protein